MKQVVESVNSAVAVTWMDLSKFRKYFGLAKLILSIEVCSIRQFRTMAELKYFADNVNQSLKELRLFPTWTIFILTKDTKQKQFLAL